MKLISSVMEKNNYFSNYMDIHVILWWFKYSHTYFYRVFARYIASQRLNVIVLHSKTTVCTVQYYFQTEFFFHLILSIIMQHLTSERKCSWHTCMCSKTDDSMTNKIWLHALSSASRCVLTNELTARTNADINALFWLGLVTESLRVPTWYRGKWVYG